MTGHHPTISGANQGHSLHECFVEQSPTAALVASPAGAISLWNAAAERLFGYCRADVLGKNPFAMLVNRIDPEIHQRAFRELKERGSIRICFENLTKDGRILQCKWHCWLVFGDSGQLLGTACFIEEEGRHASIERAQLESEVLLNAILETAAVGICVTDEDGRFVLVNRAYCELYGYRSEDLLEKPLTVLLPPAQHAPLLQQYRQLLATESPECITSQAPIPYADGTARHVAISARRLVRTDGQRFLVSSVSDLTIQKAQADELARRAHQAESDSAEKSHLLIELDQKLAIINRQHQQIAELSAPILDVWESIIALPLMGRFDRARVLAVTELLLAAVVARRAHFVLLDLTSSQFSDSSHVQLVVQIVQAVQLLGAQCVLTGIQPQVAQTLVALNVDMSRLRTLRSLQQALVLCIPEMAARRDAG